MAEVRFKIEDIKDGDVFYYCGMKCIAAGDAHELNDCYDGSWIVTDMNGDDFFDEDIDCAVPDSDEVPFQVKVKLYDDNLLLIAKATGMRIHNADSAEEALGKLLKRLAAVMEQNGGQLPPLPSKS